MDKETVLSLLRHALTVAGGWLVGRGFLQAEAAPELVGSIVSIAGIGWGWFNARQKTTLKDAVSGNIAIDHPKVLAIVPDPAPTTPITTP